jgi:hypothetical protein
MSEEVRRLISGLDQVRDVNRHWQAIDGWVSDEDDGRLRELAVSLLRMESDVEPRPWQPGSLLEHLRGRLALTPGRWSTAFLIDQLITAAMPVRQLRETAARLASAQEPNVIIAALEEHQGETELAEFLYVLIHEAVLRQKLDDTTSIAVRLSNRMRHEGHPLARLPLSLSDLETEVPALLPQYGPQGSSVVLRGISDGRDEDRTILIDCGPVPPFKEVTSPEMVDRAVRVVRAWCEESNGTVECRMFGFEEPIPARSATPSLLRSLGLESLAETCEEAVHLTAITPAQGFGHLFSAAVTGGVSTSGEGGAYGRLAAWESLVALTGCQGDDLARASLHAGECSWFSFEGEGAWFYNVAWDFALAVLRPDGKSLAILAATDTD